MLAWLAIGVGVTVLALVAVGLALFAIGSMRDER
jgi:hypothetical protein